MAAGPFLLVVALAVSAGPKPPPPFARATAAGVVLGDLDVPLEEEERRRSTVEADGFLHVREGTTAVAFHGISVDDRGTTCPVPSGGSAHDAPPWIRVEHAERGEVAWCAWVAGGGRLRLQASAPGVAPDLVERITAPVRAAILHAAAARHPAGTSTERVECRLAASGARVRLPAGWGPAGTDAEGHDVVAQRGGQARIAVWGARDGCARPIADAVGRGDAGEGLAWPAWHPTAARGPASLLLCAPGDEDGRGHGRGGKRDVLVRMTPPPGDVERHREVLEALRAEVALAEPLPETLWFGGVELHTAALRGAWFVHRLRMPRTLERDVEGGVVQVYAARRGARCRDEVARPEWLPGDWSITGQGLDAQAAWIDVCTPLPGRGASAHYRVAVVGSDPAAAAEAVPLLDAVVRDAREQKGIAGPPGARAEFE